MVQELTMSPPAAPLPKDALGHTIREGYTVLYPTLRGTDLSLKRGVVERIVNVGTPEFPRWHLKVRREGGKNISTVRNLERVVVVVE